MTTEWKRQKKPRGWCEGKWCVNLCLVNREMNAFGKRNYAVINSDIFRANSHKISIGQYFFQNKFEIEYNGMISMFLMVSESSWSFFMPMPSSDTLALRRIFISESFS